MIVNRWHFKFISAGFIVFLCGFLFFCTAVSAEDTEVVIVATQHFITDMPQGYTPAHLRALLNKISADVLLVEAPVNVNDPWQFAPMDLWQVTRPWAEKNNIKVIPAGWYEAAYQTELQRMFQVFQQKGNFVEYQRMEADFQANSAREVLSCEYVNSQPARALWREYHRQLHNFYGQDTPWETWNRNIVNNLLKLIEENKGGRLAVIFGSAHAYYFYDQLRGRAGVKILPISRFFPLSAEEIEKNTQPVDYLRALRVLNFGAGAVPSNMLFRLEDFLEKIKEFPQFENDYLLFRGKFLMHLGKAEEALAFFDKLTQLNDSVLSLFDNLTSLKHTGLLNSALARIQMKEYEQARLDLQKLLDNYSVNQMMKNAARQLMNTLPASKN